MSLRRLITPPARSIGRGADLGGVVVERQHAAIYRDHPFLQPPDQVNWLRRMLKSEDLRGRYF